LLEGDQEKEGHEKEKMPEITVTKGLVIHQKKKGGGNVTLPQARQRRGETEENQQNQLSGQIRGEGRASTEEVEGGDGASRGKGPVAGRGETRQTD